MLYMGERERLKAMQTHFTDRAANRWAEQLQRKQCTAHLIARIKQGKHLDSL